ncbi:MAG: helix-turn-helix transcriptional regulator [Gemmatimonadales bacterium]|nr:helix-turn-helix transcriptional regulator [Gemmatimonadales bacterium]
MIVANRTYLAGLHQPRHAHDSMAVTMLLAGTLRERVGRVEETAHPLSLVVKPVGVEHENHFGGQGVQTVQLLLDAPEAAELAQVEPALRAWRWIHTGAFARPFLALARAVQAGDAFAAELATADALAAIDAPPSSGGAPPLAVRLVKSRLDDDPKPPRIRDLARDAGMHPVYLARLFRRHVGTTMMHYLRQRRVRQVVSRLDSGTPLSNAAHEAGFADHAHMCRAFRAETGVTPSEYRVLLAG